MSNKNIAYPFQVARAIQQKNNEIKTLGIDAQLSVPDNSADSKNMPLEMHSGFSRFKVTLIKKTQENSSFVFANIPANDVPFIFEKTKAAINVLTNGNVNSSAVNDNLSPAYIERFNMGNLKGKTPAQVLLENPDNKAELIKQGEFLSKNAEKFPANKKMIEAIKDAINLQKNGKLVDTKTDKPSGLIEIYNEPMKPLKSKTNEKGYNMVYGIKVICDTSKKLPFYIEIMNCYAPLEVTSTGTLNPKMKEAENIEKFYMNLTEKDWYKIIDRINKTIVNFEMINFKNQFNLATESFFANSKEASKENVKA